MNMRGENTHHCGAPVLIMTAEEKNPFTMISSSVTYLFVSAYHVMSNGTQS